MNTNSENITELNKMLNEINNSLDFVDEDKLQFEVEMLHLNIMAEVSKFMTEENINKAKLAEILNTSASYITQLFTGDKVANFKLLVKFQRAFNMHFEIKATRNHAFHSLNNKESSLKVIPIWKRQLDSIPGDRYYLDNKSEKPEQIKTA